jgi:hypothetical protein
VETKVLQNKVSRVMARSTTRCAVVFTVLATAASVLLIGGGGASSARPSRAVLSVSPSVVSVGQQVYVTSSGFTPDTVFELEICGDDELAGSPDCDLTGSLTRTTSELGHFAGNLTVVVPPVPCPCVVAAFSDEGTPPITEPITIEGAPYSSLTYPPGPPKFVVEKATLAGWSIAEWFGAPPKRTLVLELRNPGSQTVYNPVVLAHVGSTPIPAYNLPAIAARGVRTYRIPVSFPVLAFGSYDVVGRTGAGNGLFVRFSVTTLLLPWALLVLAFAILLFLLFRAFLAIRKRFLKRSEQRTKAAGVPGSTESVVESTTTPEEQVPASTETTT